MEKIITLLFLCLFVSMVFNNSEAKFIEYKRGASIVYVYDDVADEGYKPSELAALSAYQTAKGLGQVEEVVMTSDHYHRNPDNIRKRKLKARINGPGYSSLTDAQKDRLWKIVIRELL
jgi:hypothetical protein